MCTLKGSGTFRQGGGKDMQMHRDIKRERENERLCKEKVKQVCKFHLF